MKKIFAITIALVMLLTALVSCDNILRLASYDDVRQYLLYHHITYNGTPYYLAESGLNWHGTYDVIYVTIVDEDGNPYDAERQEEAWFFTDSDPEINYIYFNSAYYTKDKSLASEHYGFNEKQN